MVGILAGYLASYQYAEQVQHLSPNASVLTSKHILHAQWRHSGLGPWYRHFMLGNLMLLF